MFYFNHIDIIPLSVRLPIYFLGVAVLLGLAALLIRLIDKKLSSGKIHNILMKPKLYVRQRLIKKHGFEQSDFDMVDAAMDAQETTARGRFFIMWLVLVSVMIFALIFCSVSFYSSAYSVDFDTAKDRFDVYEMDCKGYAKMHGGEMTASSVTENSEFYVNEYVLTLNGKECSVQLCYDRVDKMIKMCVGASFDKAEFVGISDSSAVKAMVGMFGLYSLSDIKKNDVSEFLGDYQSDKSDILSDGYPVYRYSNTDDFSDIYLIETDSGYRLLVSGVLKLNNC